MNSTETSIKSENIVKSEKSKVFNENVKKTNEAINSVRSERNTENNSESSINQMHMMASSSASLLAEQQSQSNNCYLNETTPATYETPFNSDDLYFRNYAGSGSDITRPIVSYANEMIANRALAANYDYSSVRNYENAMNTISTSAAFDRYDMNLSNLYASTLPMQRPGITYPSYLQSIAQDDQHHLSAAQATMLKSEHCSETPTPFYPRPMYHYDPSFSLSRFPAMNLALRTAATTNSSVPIIDLSTQNVSSSNAYSASAQYSTVHRSNDTNTPSASPKRACSPNSSPQANSNDRSIDSNLDDRMPLINSDKNNRTYPLQADNLSADHNVRRSISNSRSPQTEPVNLCNAPLKTLPFSTNNSIENAQNRPYSRESTSDSNASPYIDAYKGDSMGK